MAGRVIEGGAIALEVIREARQSSDVNQLIWNIRDIVADPPWSYRLGLGDLIFTGTPEGLGASARWWRVISSPARWLAWPRWR